MNVDYLYLKKINLNLNVIFFILVNAYYIFMYYDIYANDLVMLNLQEKEIMKNVIMFYEVIIEFIIIIFINKVVQVFLQFMINYLIRIIIRLFHQFLHFIHIHIHNQDNNCISNISYLSMIQIYILH